MHKFNTSNDWGSATALDVTDDTLTYVQVKAARFISELNAFIRFPSISAQPEHAEDLKRCAVWLADHLRQIGLAQVTVPGGFDCSGFVWRIFKTKPFAGAPETLATVIKGRTTYEMSAEIPKARRIPLEGLQPGDLVFFGDRGPKSKPNQVIHAGIFVGNGWFVHSSGAGVTLQPLQGWYQQTFAWGRRPLAEAGLVL